MSTAISDLMARLQQARLQLTGPEAPWALEQRQINGVELRAYKRAPGTLREAIDAGRAHGAKPFISYQEERYSFSEFFDAADRLANYLVKKRGICKGDRVAIAMRNYPEWMISFVALVSIGAVAVPLNSWGRTGELSFAIGDAGARLVICDPERLGYLREQLGALECSAILVRGVDSESPEGPVVSWRAALDAPPRMPEEDIGPGDLALIMYTSGTTGRARGAASTHFAVSQALYNFEYHAALSAMANMPTIEAMMASGYEPATLLAVPLFHVSGCYAVFLGNLRGGRKTAVMYRWNPEEALAVIERERITTFTGSPAMVLSLLESPSFATSDTSSLFALGAGGGACPPHLKDLIYDRLPRAYPGTGYGLTETNATCSSCTGEAFRLRPNSAGTLSPIVDVKTVDCAGRELEPGATGELYVRSPTNVQRYWNLPEESAATFVDGWVATGDLGYVDDDGFLYVVDRIKDVVIRGGENIYPVEVEGVLTSHPAVQEASVFGVPHDHWGEELVACVRLGDGEADEQSLRDYVASQLAEFKVPAHIVFRNEALPRNATGKVLKQQVRQSYLSSGA